VGALMEVSGCYTFLFLHDADVSYLKAAPLPTRNCLHLTAALVLSLSSPRMMLDHVSRSKATFSMLRSVILAMPTSRLHLVALPPLEATAMAIMERRQQQQPQA
jgi:hypothetical protein